MRYFNAVFCATLTLGISATRDPSITERLVGPGPIVSPAVALPLYYQPASQPACGDIRQHIGDDTCWFAATLCALAKGNPGWLTSKVSFDGDVNKLSKATFTVYSPGDPHTPYPQIVNCADAIGEKNDNNEEERAWWPGGFEQAARQASEHLITADDGATFGFKDGEFVGGSSYYALQILTGLQSNNNVSTDADWSEDTVWTVALHADDSPIVIGTKPEATKLWDSHAYTLMTTSSPDGIRTLNLRNSNGERDEVNWLLHDIFDEIVGIYYLHGFPAWTG